MSSVSTVSRKKTWQSSRERVSVLAALAIQRENVMQRLLRLRTEVGHPEKPGEPLQQDQAAQRAGVTVRQWQRWEAGQSIPYARNLAAVADAFQFDVGEFYDGPVGQLPAQTPDPFADTEPDRRDELAEQIATLVKTLDAHGQLLADILERLREDDDDEEGGARRSASGGPDPRLGPTPGYLGPEAQDG